MAEIIGTHGQDVYLIALSETDALVVDTQLRSVSPRMSRKGAAKRWAWQLASPDATQMSAIDAVLTKRGIDLAGNPFAKKAPAGPPVPGAAPGAPGAKSTIGDPKAAVDPSKPRPQPDAETLAAEQQPPVDTTNAGAGTPEERQALAAALQAHAAKLLQETGAAPIDPTQALPGQVPNATTPNPAAPALVQHYEMPTVGANGELMPVDDKQTPEGFKPDIKPINQIPPGSPPPQLPVPVRTAPAFVPPPVGPVGGHPPFADATLNIGACPNCGLKLPMPGRPGSVAAPVQGPGTQNAVAQPQQIAQPAAPPVAPVATNGPVNNPNVQTNQPTPQTSPAVAGGAGSPNPYRPAGVTGATGRCPSCGAVVTLADDPADTLPGGVDDFDDADLIGILVCPMCGGDVDDDGECDTCDWSDDDGDEVQQALDAYEMAADAPSLASAVRGRRGGSPGIYLVSVSPTSAVEVDLSTRTVGAPTNLSDLEAAHAWTLCRPGAEALDAIAATVLTTLIDV